MHHTSCCSKWNRFSFVINKSDNINTYKYIYVNDPYVSYTKIHTPGTLHLHSLVTFKPADIPDAPVMVVNTYVNVRNPKSDIYLPRNVDAWEIKYYSKCGGMPDLDSKYLKNAGVVNLNEFFGKYIWNELFLELGWGQFILGDNGKRWSIPDVD